jgi:hypothetical protein
MHSNRFRPLSMSCGILAVLSLIAVPARAWESLTFDLPSGGRESLWRDALSRQWHGQIEKRIEGGRIDVLTDQYAVEVEFPYKWHEGLGQSLHYASATGKQGVLAIIAYAQGEANLQDKSRHQLEMIEKLCASNGIKMVVLFPNRPEDFPHRAAGAGKKAIN